LFPRLKRQLPVFAPLVAGLLILTLATALGGLWHYGYELDHQPSSGHVAAASAEAAALQKTAAAAGSNAVTNAAASGGNNGPGASGRTAASTAAARGTSAAASPAASQSAAQSAPAMVGVALSVNHQGRGTVRLTAGSNQCDVLSQALNQGLISSLDMRYSDQYHTQGVYVIDGLGDPGTVWWTYTVNGSPPPYGCAYVTVHNGDSVNWQYVKS
jgi:hypothetical protein